MQPRSALFDQTVASSHQELVQADVLSGGRVIASGLPVVGGSVSGDRSQFARRTCSVVIGDPAYIPAGRPGTATVTTQTQTYQTPSIALYPGTSLYPGTALYPSVTSPGGWQTSYASTTTALPADLLAPYGNEIRLWRGAVTPAGPELICVGTFGIRSVAFDDGGAFTGITVTGIDRCKRISEARFPFPRTSPAGITIVEEAAALISEVVPYAEVRVDQRVWDMQLPQVTWTSARDAAITDMMTSIGAEVFCDPLGAFVIAPVPSLSDPAVFEVTSGDGGILVSARHSLTRDGVHNGVVARGQTTTSDPAPTSELAVDNDPTSPTYWYGPFGQVVGFYDSSLLTTQAQCNAAAWALLNNTVGAARSISYTTAVNPALEPGDVVLVTNKTTGVVEKHLQDTLTIPLDAGGVMSADTRSSVAWINEARRRQPPIYLGGVS